MLSWDNCVHVHAWKINVWYVPTWPSGHIDNIYMCSRDVYIYRLLHHGLVSSNGIALNASRDCPLSEHVSDTRYAMCWRLTAQTLLTKECRVEIMHLTIVLMSYNEVWLCKNWNPIFTFFYTDVTKLIKI